MSTTWGDTLPRFTSAEGRDRKYAEYVAAGGTIYDGTLCWVGEILCCYNGANWTTFPPVKP